MRRLKSFRSWSTAGSPRAISIDTTGTRDPGSGVRGPGSGVRDPGPPPGAMWTTRGLKPPRYETDNGAVRRAGASAPAVTTQVARTHEEHGNGNAESRRCQDRRS